MRTNEQQCQWVRVISVRAIIRNYCLSRNTKRAWPNSCTDAIESVTLYFTIWDESLTPRSCSSAGNYTTARNFKHLRLSYSRLKLAFLWLRRTLCSCRARSRLPEQRAACVVSSRNPQACNVEKPWPTSAPPTPSDGAPIADILGYYGEIRDTITETVNPCQMVKPRKKKRLHFRE